MAMEKLRIAAKESKVMKFILGGFIFLAVGGLVFTDVRGFFSGGVGGSTVARVGSEKIDIRRFDSDVRRFAQQANMTVEEAYQYGLVDVFLNSRIDTILQTQAADDLNIRLSDQEIAKRIADMFAGSSKNEIQAQLRAYGMSEGQLAQSIRTQAMNDVVQKMPLAVTNYVPSFVADAVARVQSEKRDGVLYKIGLDKMVQDIAVTDQDAMDFYNSNIAEYTVAEERQFVIGKMTLDMVKKDAPHVSNDDVRAEYDARQKDFTVSEKRSIAQAVVNNPDEAQSIYEKAMGGEPLSKAVQNVMGDKAAYRDVSEYELKGLPDDLADVAFGDDVRAGDVLPPVKTLLGYVVMKVTKITPETLKSFSSVRVDLKKEMQQNALYDALYNKILDTEEMVDQGEAFDVIADKTGLKISKTNFVTHGSLATVGGDLAKALEVSPTLKDEIFALNAGAAAYPLELDDETYLVIGVKDVKDEAVLDFDDVKKDIEKTVLDNKKQGAAHAKATSLMADLNQGRMAVAELKKVYKVTEKPFKKIALDTSSANKDIIFGTPKDKFGYKVNDKDQVVFVLIKDIHFDGEKTPDAALNAQLNSQQNAMVTAAQRAYYRDHNTVKINRYLLDQAYGGQSVGQ